MGVSGLKTWLQDELPGCWVKGANTSAPVDHVYVDLNFVLHTSLNRCKPKTRRKFRREIEVWLNRMLKQTNPRKTLFVAVDGPGPIAKVLHQRAKRLQEANKLQRLAGDAAEQQQQQQQQGGGENQKDGRGGDELCSLELTPGTRLMSEVDSWLRDWACKKLYDDEGEYNKFAHLKVTLSGSTVVGEGETKIIGQILSRSQYKGDHHFIWTADSDMCLMAIQPGVNNVFVYLDDWKDKGKWDKTSFSVDNFFDHTTKNVQFEGYLDRRKWESEVARDFMCICIMASGNDYLPGVVGLRQTAWNAYLKLKRGPLKHAMLIGPEGKLDKGILAKITKKGAKSNERGYEEMASLFRAPANAQDYLYSLHWCSSMYASGVCQDYRWTYDGVGPSIEMMCQTEFMEGADDKKGGALLPTAMALSLIPKSYKKLVPEFFHHLMEPESPIYSLFEVCHECQAIKERLRYESANVNREREELKSLEHKMKESEDVDAVKPNKNGMITVQELEKALLNSDVNDHLEEDIESCKERIKYHRDRVKDINAQYRSHVLSEHPYKPFPTDLVDKLVKQAIPQNLTKTEEYLNNFGNPFSFAGPANRGGRGGHRGRGAYRGRGRDGSTRGRGRGRGRSRGRGSYRGRGRGG